MTFVKINLATTPLENVGKELVKVMKNVIIVPTNAFVLLKIAGMFNRKLQSYYIDSMYKTFTAYSYIFLFPLGTNKTALDPSDVRLCEVV